MMLTNKFGIVTDYHDGRKIDTVYTRKGAGVVSTTYIDGDATTTSKVYKINTDKPYVRWGGRKWYITDEHLEIMRSVI